MYKNLYLGIAIGLLICASNNSVLADSLYSFDFDPLGSKAYRKKTSQAVEAYMESLYGDDISVSKGTKAAKGNFAAPAANSQAAYIGEPSHAGMYLRSSGKNPIVLDFGTNGVSSFSVDWKLFKNAKGISILADGFIIDHETLSQAQKKSGAGGNLTLFFDESVQKLEFVGVKNTRFGLDNLLLNLPEPDGSALPTISSLRAATTSINAADDILPISGTEAASLLLQVPEPTSLLLFGFGLIAFSFLWPVNKADLNSDD